MATGTNFWERQVERMQGSHAGLSSFRGEAERQQSSGGSSTEQRMERREEEEGKEGADRREERAGTKLRLGPCRMHKAGTRDTKTNHLTKQNNQNKCFTKGKKKIIKNFNIK